ncbi:MAG: hypothetical protein JST16_13735 [Bdellovibrionales bacterium]|nr:hypothetical protein [Bdellovibrionales bacterium]
MLPLAYGLSTLASLWAFGGGDMSLFWTRQFVLSVIVLLLAINLIVITKKQSMLRGHSGTLMLGAGSALATALPFVVLAWLTKHTSMESMPMLRASVLEIVPPSFVAVLISAILLAPGYEIISRGFLAPNWGLSGVAFLDALAFGFGTQRLIPFLVIWMMGYFWGILASRFGTLTSVVSRMLWTLIVLSALTFT